MSTPESKDPADGADILSEHAYDGIQEYDNPTPFWWDLLFVATALFAPLYALWFHAPRMERNLEGQYQRAVAANLRLQFGEIGELQPNEETLVQYLHDPKWLKVGASAFATNCVSCHGRQGEGISGPNLTDESYLHVKQITDIAKVVAEGANKGAMPAWSNRLHPNEVVLVAAYVASLRGQNLDSKYAGKTGSPIGPWPEPPAPKAADNDKQAPGDTASE